MTQYYIDLQAKPGLKIPLLITFRKATYNSTGIKVSDELLDFNELNFIKCKDNLIEWLLNTTNNC